MDLKTNNLAAKKISRTLDKDQREVFEKNFNKFLDLTEPLQIYLKYELEKCLLEKTKEADFDCANWAMKQAYLNGEIQTLKNLIDILTNKDL